MDFSSPKIVQARLTNQRTKEFVEFHLNPEKLKHEKGSHFVEDPVPGFSHPLRRWASGKAEIVTFKLRLDGQISIKKFGVTLENGLNPTPNQPCSVLGFIDWVRAFNHPTDPVADVGGTGANDLAVFNWGKGYQNWTADIEIPVWELLEWDAEGTPTRAEMDIKLTKNVINSENYGTVWRFDR